MLNILFMIVIVALNLLQIGAKSITEVGMSINSGIFGGWSGQPEPGGSHEAYKIWSTPERRGEPTPKEIEVRGACLDEETADGTPCREEPPIEYAPPPFEGWIPQCDEKMTREKLDIVCGIGVERCVYVCLGGNKEVI